MKDWLRLLWQQKQNEVWEGVIVPTCLNWSYDFSNKITAELKKTGALLSTTKNKNGSKSTLKFWVFSPTPCQNVWRKKTTRGCCPNSLRDGEKALRTTYWNRQEEIYSRGIAIVCNLQKTIAPDSRLPCKLLLICIFSSHKDESFVSSWDCRETIFQSWALRHVVSTCSKINNFRVYCIFYLPKFIL